MASSPRSTRSSPRRKAEATRHEGRRVAATEKFAALTPDGDAKERLDLTTSLVTLTKRAALMESQVDVLEGKRRALARYRDALVDYLGAMGEPRSVDAAADAADGRRSMRLERGAPTRTRRCRPPSRASSSVPRRTCAARSRGRCTMARPRA